MATRKKRAKKSGRGRAGVARKAKGGKRGRRPAKRVARRGAYSKK
jgi:hypothetical protein